LLYGQTTYNPVSRFISEIPEKLIEKVGGSSASAVPVRGGYAAPTWGGARGAEAPVKQVRTYYTDRTPARGTPPTGTAIPRNPAPARSTTERVTVGQTPAPKKPTGGVKLAPGDRVRHMTFGEGEILSAKPMGQDILYEVAFDRVGTKKLMGTYARLTKL
jgi:hypothetical protein